MPAYIKDIPFMLSKQKKSELQSMTSYNLIVMTADYMGRLTAVGLTFECIPY